MNKPIDVVTVGNAIVDVLGRVDDEFLQRLGVEKGIMQLIDTERAKEIYAAMGPATESSGGSAGNTAAGLANLGSRVAYIGKVKQDQLGEIFTHDMRALGAQFDTTPAPETHPLATARSFVLVTPDGERSMNTYLGVAPEVTADDMDETLLSQTKWIYVEGYLWDTEAQKAAIRTGIERCKAAGGNAALSLSDPFCVERHRDSFLELIRSGQVDLVFGNHHELCSLYQTEDVDQAMALLREDVPMAAITLGPDGSMVITKTETVTSPAAPKTRVDATGAGDLFAAGFLHGLCQSQPLATCAHYGNLVAGETISQMGARPNCDLKALIADA